MRANPTIRHKHAIQLTGSRNNRPRQHDLRGGAVSAGGGLNSEGAAEENDEGFSTADKERKIQIAGVFDLSAKFAKLVRHRVDNAFSAIGERDLHVVSNDLRLANVQQLASDNEEIAFRMRFELEIDLIGLNPVKHLPDAHSG